MILPQSFPTSSDQQLAQWLSGKVYDYQQAFGVPQVLDGDWYKRMLRDAALILAQNETNDNWSTQTPVEDGMSFGSVGHHYWYVRLKNLDVNSQIVSLAASGGSNTGLLLAGAFAVVGLILILNKK